MSSASGKNNKSAGFAGYSRDRFEVFRQQKEEIFHQKYGRFATKKPESLVNSRDSTMSDPGPLFAMENLFDDSKDKLNALETILEDVKTLHTRLRLQTLNQNQRDAASYKEKLSFSLSKLNEVEQNIGEIKGIQPEDGKHHQEILRRNLVTALNVQLREKVNFLNKFKSLQQDAATGSSDFGFLDRDNTEQDERLSLFQDDRLKREALQYESEVDKAVEGIRSIHSLFKQMNDIVMQNGEVVDRIDYNIDTAMKSVQRGKKELIKAQQYQENGCARKFIKGQITLVLFLALLIFLKYSK
jgi:SNARE domain